MKSFTNRTHLFTTVTLLLIAGFFLTNIISYKAAKSTLRDNIINTSLPLTRDNIYTEIQRDIMLPVYVSSLMANDTFLRDWVLSGEDNIETISKYLNEIKTKYGFFTSFFISEATSSYYYFGGKLKTISRNNKQDGWYYTFKNKHIPYELNIDTSEAHNYALTIFINHRVYDYEHNLIGVTGVGLDMERITNLLSAYRVKYNRNIFLTNKRGLIKAHHEKDLVEIANIRLMEGISSIAGNILEVEHQSENFEYDIKNTHILLTRRFIPELDWFLIVEQNQNLAIENIWLNFIKSSVVGMIISAAVLFIIISAINYYNRKLEKLAITDELTGSFNRREFSKIYKKAVSLSGKTNEPFSVILTDIDNFKEVNDTNGHLMGDNVIKAVTEVCNSSIRDDDMVARWGGDEFILLIYGTKEIALTIAERINTGLRNHGEIKTLRASGINVTLSMGISEYKYTDTEDSITIRADRALYAAKESGKNKIVCGD